MRTHTYFAAFAALTFAGAFAAAQAPAPLLTRPTLAASAVVAPEIVQGTDAYKNYQEESKALDEKIEARKQTIAKEDPEAVQLAADVEQITAEYFAKKAELDAMYNTDDELRDLNERFAAAEKGRHNAHMALVHQIGANMRERTGYNAHTANRTAESVREEAKAKTESWRESYKASFKEEEEEESDE